MYWQCGEVSHFQMISAYRQATHVIETHKTHYSMAHGRMALSLQRRCTRFFAAIWLRHRSNSGFAGTEPSEAPYARTGIITDDGKTE